MVQSLVAAGVGGVVYGLLEWRTAALVVWTIAALNASAALLSPLGVFARIEQGFAALGAWVGTALTWVVMPPIFYAIFLPFGLLFRRGRRDPMKRYFERDAATYWKERDPEWESTRSRERPF